jgi:cysteine-rich repeat protein
MRVRHRSLALVIALFGLHAPAVARAEPLRLSTDGNAALGSPPLAFGRDAVIELRTRQGAATVFFDERNFPNAENIDAVHALANGLIVLSTAAEATLGDPPLTFQDGDLVAYDPIGDTATIVFAEAAHFSDNQDIDAVFLRNDGTVVLSTRDPATLGSPPLAFSPGDLVAYDPSARTATIVLPVSRFAAPENIDAAHELPDGRFVLSVERATGAQLGGVTFRDGDLILYDPVADHASLFFSETAFGTDENIDALHLGCGNGLVESDEECDEAGATPTCHADCTIPTCGDGMIDPALGEACDDRGESATCDLDCTTVSCGDGTRNASAGEACDAAGESATCDADCSLAACGDGTANASAGEACDDGGESAACDADCSPATCGDGTLNVTRGETCDDGGTVAGDCCSPTCDLDPAATPCPDDGDACTTIDACDGAGMCAHHPVPAPGCRTPALPGKAALILKDKEGDERDQLVWKWTKGAVSTRADFGDPEHVDDYTLCLYEERPAGAEVRLRARAPSGGDCRGRPCWSARRAGLKYLDKDLTPDGILKLDLKEGTVPGKAKIILKAKGAALPLPALPLVPPLRVQLHGAAGQCWEARYTEDGIRSNESGLFRARSE